MTVEVRGSHTECGAQWRTLRCMIRRMSVLGRENVKGKGPEAGKKASVAGL